MARNIYLWGDSIGKGVIYHEQRGRYCLAENRCTALLARAGVPMESHARMGATLRDGYADFCQTQTQAGGIAVIEFGGNDCDLDWQAVAEHPEVFHDGRVPLAEFQALLAQFIADARRRKLTPVLVTPPPLLSQRYFAWVSRGRDRDRILQYLGDVEHIYRWQERYAQAVREAAWQAHVPLMDMRQVFLAEPRLPELFCVDGIHPAPQAHALMARAVLAWLPDALPGNRAPGSLGTLPVRQAAFAQPSL